MKIIGKQTLTAMINRHLPGWDIKFVSDIPGGSCGECNYTQKSITLKYIGPRDIHRGGMNYIYTAIHEIAHAKEECHCQEYCEHWIKHAKELCDIYNINLELCKWHKSKAIFFNSK